ncbi:MAG: VCBS repeat-containing protein, partial [Candidatus Eremiobacteraeota bacterium]|nr:VCBS repeat-containing protein [Candidatus Eremiobacteraeota bacterium]
MKVVSVASDGTQGNADSTQASISADGRFVVFRSAATNLVAGDSNATADIFLHVVATGVTTRVSTSTVGGQSNGASQTPAVSAGGRFVVFASVATNLTTADNNGVQDIFLKDTSTGATTLVSSNSALTESANGASHDPAITGGSAVEGEFIAFSTEATDIIAGGLNGQRQIVLIKRENPSSRELVSQSALGAQADGPCYEPSLSNDGENVAFFTLATNLGPVLDKNGLFDVYQRAVAGNTTERLSLDPANNESDGHSGYPSLSGDGATVAFGSLATNLVTDDLNGRFDVFRRSGGFTELASQSTAKVQGDSDSDLPGISLDGRYIAFRSAASTLFGFDTTTDDDIFIRENGTPGTFWASISCLFPSLWPGFEARLDLATGNGPTSVARADFDGDGNLDLAVSNSTSHNLSVLLGDGTGGFGAPTNFAVGTNPVEVAVGDFNGDLKLDLVTANLNSDNVSILLGDGSGGFGAATHFSTGFNPAGLVVGDFNGDLDLDVATANNGSTTVSVLLGDGSGGLGMATDFNVGSSANSIAAGRFNADSHLDLIVAKSGANSVALLLGNGAGGFGAANNFAVGSNPVSVRTGDFNGDTRLDLVTANIGGNNLSLRLGDGLGGFGAVT